MSRLYVCVPEQPRCYDEAGPTVVEVVEREQAQLEDALAQTDDDCLAEVGALYSDALDAYGDAGRAAVRGRPAAVDRAITRSTEAEIAYLEKMGDCGFSQGRLGEAGARLRRVDAELLRLGEEITACPDEACVVRVARKMEATGREGLRSVDEMLREVRGEEDAPACLAASFSTVRDAYETLVRASRALQARDYEAAERGGTRSIKLAAEAQEDLADCLGTLEE